jgi:hypothetical protein
MPPLPVQATFLDLPLLSGDEVPHAPYLALTANPWPGQVALYSAQGEDGFTLDSIYPVPSVMGETLGPLQRAAPGVWDRGAALRVRLVRGALASASEERVLAGGNLVAIGDGLTDLWEVFQFADAELVAPRTYDIRMRLRGQRGSDGAMPVDWPAGSRFVLLDGLPAQIGLSAADRGVTRTWRWGPAMRPIGDPSYRTRNVAFAGIGLRPYAVCHLRAAAGAGGATEVAWIRRTRIDGDLWGSEDVPLGETAEIYAVQVMADGVVRREVRTGGPSWTYPANERAADGVTGGFFIRVAQVSDRFGPGPFRGVWVEAG